MIYLDNHSTTRVDPRVVAVMLPLMDSEYANAGSSTHVAGRMVAEKVDDALKQIASCIGADAEADAIVVTSGATESNNLAIFGVCLHPRQKRRRVVSVVTEHRAVLDPLERLKHLGFEVILLPVFPQGHPLVGQIDLNQAEDVIDDTTALVSVMHSNNEIGCYQPLKELAELCRQNGSVFHSDATQSVGFSPMNMQDLGMDMMSFSAHKFYGPKGIGGLFVASDRAALRLYPQILGGGQQLNRRSGTLNSVSIIGMAEAIRICVQEMNSDKNHLLQLRNALWTGLQQVDPLRIALNGPEPIDTQRLDRNLNVYIHGIEGQTLMMRCPDLCMSSGSACTSSDPYPSHVLQAIGRSVDEARCSLRFGVGRFNTQAEIDLAIEKIAKAIPHDSRAT